MTRRSLVSVTGEPAAWRTARTPPGILLGLLSTALAVGPAALAVTRPHWAIAADRSLSLRRLQSGHVGDYVALLLFGAAALGAPTMPGVVGG